MSARVPGPLPVPLEYPVYCHEGALSALAPIVAAVAPGHRVAIISDDTVAPLHAAAVLAQFPAATTQLFTIPPGEQEKTRAQWGALTDALCEWGAGRDTTIIALGGGVIGDLAGFVAATFMRGIPVVQVPTTLLAMVDAAVGGKTAVDSPYGKNLVGAFHNPSAVVMDPGVLRTLPTSLRRAGLAEMIKHGVIADAAYFDTVLQALPRLAAESALSAPTTASAVVAELATLVAGSVRIKADVVAEDTREGGLRQVLNFGHTIAHAIERELHFTMAHGEAVAIGMVVEARIAEHLGLAPAGLHLAIAEAVRMAGLPWTIPAALTADGVVEATRGDKKARGGMVRYALPRGIGEMETGDGHWSVAVPDDVVRQAVLASFG